jgi:hypothetical protein
VAPVVAVAAPECKRPYGVPSPEPDRERTETHDALERLEPVRRRGDGPVVRRPGDVESNVVDAASGLDREIGDLWPVGITNPDSITRPPRGTRG